MTDIENKKLNIPVGGIIMGVISAGLFFWSTRSKKRINNLEDSKHYDHNTIENALEGEYCSLSGSIQPLNKDKYVRTGSGKDTVIYISSIVERVKVTRQKEEVRNQRTRNPRVVYTTNSSTEEQIVQNPIESRVHFGLFDMKTKKNIELNIHTNVFIESMKTEKIIIPNNNQQGGININLGGSSVPIIGETRTIESIWRVEKYLPIEKLEEGDRLNIIGTVFGHVTKSNNNIIITDDNNSFSFPSIFSFGSRSKIISDEKFTSRVLHISALVFLVLGGVTSYFEMTGFPSSNIDKIDRNW